MLHLFKSKVKAVLGRSVDDGELKRAVSAAKSDVAVNHLMMGQDVTAEQFVQVVVECIAIMEVDK